MNVSLLVSSCLAVLPGSGVAGAQPAAPLVSLAYHKLAPSTIRPTGWLRRQLEIMRDHSAGPALGFSWNAANAPVEITVSGRRLPAWQLNEGVASPPITPREGLYKGPVDPTPEALTFIPYGCTKLRVVALPADP